MTGKIIKFVINFKADNLYGTASKQKGDNLYGTEVVDIKYPDMLGFGKNAGPGHLIGGGSGALGQKWYCHGCTWCTAQVQLMRLGTAVRMTSRDITKSVTTREIRSVYQSCNLRDTSLSEVQQRLRK